MTAEELASVQTQKVSNGRLAMVAIARQLIEDAFMYIWRPALWRCP
jgi:hypothetical protein